MQCTNLLTFLTRSFKILFWKSFYVIDLLAILFVFLTVDQDKNTDFIYI